MKKNFKFFFFKMKKKFFFFIVFISRRNTGENRKKYGMGIRTISQMNFTKIIAWLTDHDVDISDAFKRVVQTAVRHLHQNLLDRLFSMIFLQKSTTKLNEKWVNKKFPSTRPGVCHKRRRVFLTGFTKSVMPNFRATKDKGAFFTYFEREKRKETASYQQLPSPNSCPLRWCAWHRAPRSPSPQPVPHRRGQISPPSSPFARPQCWVPHRILFNKKQKRKNRKEKEEKNSMKHRIELHHIWVLKAIFNE